MSLQILYENNSMYRVPTTLLDVTGVAGKVADEAYWEFADAVGELQTEKPKSVRIVETFIVGNFA